MESTKHTALSAVDFQGQKLRMTEKKMLQSLRSGHHSTVYEVRRDPTLKNKDVIRDKNKPVFPFISGSRYKGNWLHDQKHGFGIQHNPDNTKYEGEWANNMYNGRGTLWVKKGKNYQRFYVGDWVDGMMEGEGIHYYENDEIYKGSWKRGKKCGRGKYEYSTGDVYDGHWEDDEKNGFGTMNYANGNVFEGLFRSGKKEGPGLYYYAATKKVYQGEWYDDQPQCGEFRSPTAAEEIRFLRPLPKGMYFNEFTLPPIPLENPQVVLDVAITQARMNSMQTTTNYQQEFGTEFLPMEMNQLNYTAEQENEGYIDY